MRQSDYAALLARISLGVMYVSHAYLKIFTFTLAGAAAFFEKVGFAGWMVYPVVFAELIGGLMLVLGLKTRWVALALTPILFGAAYTHWSNSWVFTASGGGWEYPALLIVLSAVQALLGDGAYALKLPGHAQPATPRSFASKHA